MYKLKDAAKRGSLLLGAVGFLVGVGASAIPAFTATASADALNPLTKRSLTLSSSSPGWAYTDGSGNSTYAPPNSGANGQKTGNTFSFDVSTDTTGALGPVKTMSFQYCTFSAGNCTAPGDDSPITGPDDASHSDLNVVTSSPSQILQTDLGSYVDTTTGLVTAVPAETSTGTNFIVMYDDAGTWTSSDGWTMSAVNQEEPSSVTGMNNYIILTNHTGQGFAAGTNVKVVFFATDSNYITNPGAGAFFVKINTYNKEYSATPTTPQVDISGLEPASDANVIDGGVTVANVMNQSIQITTRVLETMDFSVGTVDPDTLSSADGDATHASTFEKAYGDAADNNMTLHGECDNILTGMTPASSVNTLALGNQSAESSLATNATYGTYSFFRLSSNSSAGASIYYSGNTLADTEGDTIAAIGTTSHTPSRGSPQFGLALDNGSLASNDNGGGYGPQNTPGYDFAVDYSAEDNLAGNAGKGAFENAAAGASGLDGVDSSVAADIASQAFTDYHPPELFPLVPSATYDLGTGSFNGAVSNPSAAGYGSATATQFAFDNGSTLIPAELATESNQVVDCVTGKVRYIANIAATTPAGIYTTKINYIAAPQY